MFIGREKELKSLNEIYAKAGFSMSIVYGRRRIGKSTLITEFIKNKRAIFYTATKVGKERNRELFTRQALEVLEPDLREADFAAIESLFDFNSKKLTAEKLIIVIDELPYWAEKNEAFLSILQKYIDTEWFKELNNEAVILFTLEDMYK